MVMVVALIEGGYGFDFEGQSASVYGGDCVNGI